MFASNHSQIFTYFMNKPIILTHNWQNICERARIIPIFIKYVGAMAKKAERNIKNLRLWPGPEPVYFRILLLCAEYAWFSTWETVKLSVRIMEVVRYFPCLRAGFLCRLYIYIKWRCFHQYVSTSSSSSSSSLQTLTLTLFWRPICRDNWPSTWRDSWRSNRRDFCRIICVGPAWLRRLICRLICRVMAPRFSASSLSGKVTQIVPYFGIYMGCQNASMLL